MVHLKLNQVHACLRFALNSIFELIILVDKKPRARSVRRIPAKIIIIVVELQLGLPEEELGRWLYFPAFRRSRYTFFQSNCIARQSGLFPCRLGVGHELRLRSWSKKQLLPYFIPTLVHLSIVAHSKRLEEACNLRVRLTLTNLRLELVGGHVVLEVDRILLRFTAVRIFIKQ